MIIHHNRYSRILSRPGGRFRRGQNARNTHIRDVRFLIKTFRKLWVNFILPLFFKQFRENVYGSQGSFIKPVFFGENSVYSNIQFSTLLFNYTHIWKTNLCRGGQNINWIGEGCDRLGKPFLPSLVHCHWATARIWVNSSQCSGE